MKGVVFDLKRFAVHDGAGLRSTLFLKGCPLRCPWCHNPEGISGAIELAHNAARCMGCGSCIPACARGALSKGGSGLEIDRGKCALDAACVDACPTGALTLCGYELTPEQALERLLRDRVFFEDGGGVTLSGGEALFQFKFALALLGLLKAQGIDTAVETCLALPESRLEQTLELVDHYLIDIKYIDGLEHERVLGMHNERVLNNYRLLVERGRDVLVRVPLIPGFTAREDNVRGIARFVASVKADQRVELLNYNPLGKGKYASRGLGYPVVGPPLSAFEMDKYRAILGESGLVAVRE